MKPSLHNRCISLIDALKNKWLYLRAGLYLFLTPCTLWIRMSLWCKAFFFSFASLFYWILFFYRGETVPVWVWRLRQAFCKQQWPEEAHARAHVGQTVFVQNVRQILHSSQFSSKAHEGRLILCKTLLVYLPNRVCETCYCYWLHWCTWCSLPHSWCLIELLEIFFFSGSRIYSVRVRLVSGSKLWIRVVHTPRAGVALHRDPEQHQPVALIRRAQLKRTQRLVVQLQWVVCLGLDQSTKKYFTHQYTLNTYSSSKTWGLNETCTTTRPKPVACLALFSREWSSTEEMCTKKHSFFCKYLHPFPSCCNRFCYFIFIF